MQIVRITTTQNVEIEYPVASIGDRILAALIDYLIVIGYFIGVAILLNLLPIGGGRSDRVALFIALYLPVFFYDLLCEILLDGQSFGKKQMKIKVIKMDGSQPDLGSYLLRWLLRVVDITLSSGGVAMLTILINGKGQRLGDMAAGTTVIKLKEDIGLHDTIFTKIAVEYQPVFPQAAALNDHDMAIVKEVLDAGLEVENIDIGNSLESRAKMALEEKMGIKSDLTPRAFLSTILQDYNYFKGRL
jgi:uncharacterized RDD family membrane protein YckC